MKSKLASLLNLSFISTYLIMKHEIFQNTKINAFWYETLLLSSILDKG